MQIELLVGRYDRMIGQAWYAASLQKYLGRIGVEISTTQPIFPFLINAGYTLLHPLGYDLKTFFSTYPLRAKFQDESIKHFTTQQMASLLSFQKVKQPIIITVHDIIPFLMRDNPKLSDYSQPYDHWMDRLSVKNLQRVDLIISVSDYTRRVLIKYMGIPEQKIRVILHGVDLDIFKPSIVPDSFIEKYHFDSRLNYMLYVGSEIPRKNLDTLLKALAIVKKGNSKVRLIKIGTPGQARFFQKFQEQIQQLDLQNEVIIINHVSRADLILFYNFADVFVFPSLYEGFGLPPLEAMACGTPVICSNSTSLPEVVGDAAISIDPLDINTWANSFPRF